MVTAPGASEGPSLAAGAGGGGGGGSGDDCAIWLDQVDVVFFPTEKLQQLLHLLENKRRIVKVSEDV